MKRLSLLILLPLILAGCAPVVRRAMYHPKHYDERHAESIAGVSRIEFETEQGRQVAHYLGAENPALLWIVFSGMASRSLDWEPAAREAHQEDPRLAFLFVEFPGYGYSEGSPSRDSLARTSDAALKAAIEQKQLSADMPIGVFGYSMGGAAALSFAERNHARRAITIATFTNIPDAAAYRFSFVGRWLVADRYDNEATLRTLMERPDFEHLTIHHGTSDGYVPLRMGYQLAAIDPSRTTMHVHDAVAHRNIPRLERSAIARSFLLSEPAK